MNNREQKDAALLAQACRMAGIDPRTIKPGNSFKKSGKTASMLQMAIAELDPVRAAELRLEAGMGFSVATIEELQSGQPLSDEAQADLYAHDPAFVREYHQQQQQSYEDQLKFMDDETERLRLKNAMVRTGGDERQAKRMIDAEDAEKAAREQQRTGVLN